MAALAAAGMDPEVAMAREAVVRAPEEARATEAVATETGAVAKATVVGATEPVVRATGAVARATEAVAKATVVRAMEAVVRASGALGGVKEVVAKVAVTEDGNDCCSRRSLHQNHNHLLGPLRRHLGRCHYLPNHMSFRRLHPQRPAKAW